MKMFAWSGMGDLQEIVKKLRVTNLDFSKLAQQWL